MSNTDVIAITRQYGSGGREIGKKLAESLNIRFFDKEQIFLAAKESGVNKEFFDETEEQMNDNLLYSLANSSNELTDNKTLYDKLFEIQTAVIKKAAQEGPCIFVDSCAEYVLREEKRVFNIFVHADDFARMDRVVQGYGIDLKKAAESLVKKDQQRANYYTYYTNKTWGDPANYNLVIDSAAIGIDDAVELIKTAVWE